MTLFMLVCACRWVQQALDSLGTVTMDRARLLELSKQQDQETR